MSLSPSRSGYQFGVLEANSSSCLARANSTCHVPFREHPGIKATTFSWFACVERPWSGPNWISRSAAKNKFVKSRATYHGHVPRGTEYIAINQIALLSSVQTQHNLLGPNWFGRSSTRSKRIKTRATCQWQVPHDTEGANGTQSTRLCSCS